MKLRSFFLLFAFLLSVVWIALMFIASKESGWIFYLIEGIITFSLIYLIYFYKKAVFPLMKILF